MCSPAVPPSLGRPMHTEAATPHKSGGGRTRDPGTDPSVQLPWRDKARDQLSYLDFPLQPRRWDPIGGKGREGGSGRLPFS